MNNLVYSYQALKFQSISFVQSTDWSQSYNDGVIMYKAIHDPFSKLIIQDLNGTKKLFHVPKDRSVIITNEIVHFLGELA